MKLKFRRLRFSLATLLMLVTALAVWLGITVNRVRRQERAVVAIQERSGIILFEHQYDETGRYDETRELTTPRWLRESLGEDFFRKATIVDLAYGAGGLKAPASKFADADLRHLAALVDVELIDLGRNRAITDAGLVHLRSLDNLENLSFFRTSVTGPGLAHIAHLPKLESLSLGQSLLTDDGMNHIGEMNRLRWLNLDNTRITDVGLSQLTSLRELKELSLANTDVTDGAVTHLKAMTSLERLELLNTHMTPQGVAELQAALPNCKINVAYGFGIEPESPPLWEKGETPTREVLLARLKELHAFPEVASLVEGKPIVGLTLMDSYISDAALMRILDQLPDLETLNLRRCVVGDELLAYLAGQERMREKLRFLSISRSRVSDAGIRHLRQLKHLLEIDLTETAVTDAGFAELKNMSNLSTIHASRTRATEQGMIELQRAMPNLHISF